ncbi:MAG: NAD(P)H-binding protein [Pseudomonadota bacterium]
MIPSRRICILGGSGTIGRATVLMAHERGWDVNAPDRKTVNSVLQKARTATRAHGTALLAELFGGEGIDAIISCVASRTGTPDDAWAVDYALNSAVCRAAEQAGVRGFVLLSAICVQRPKLAFQRAKLAFEAELQASQLAWSIVRPTAYFKSLSGQVDRLRRGKPFLVFGNGALTRCKPISDRDLATYLLNCVADQNLQRRLLPVGGPGPALTPKEQGTLLFEALDQKPHFRSVSPKLLLGAARLLDVPGRVSCRAAEKAELARIGHYYATESMLLWNGASYDAEATPEFGSDKLADHYAQLALEDWADDRGAHALF